MRSFFLLVALVLVARIAPAQSLPTGFTAWRPELRSDTHASSISQSSGLTNFSDYRIEGTLLGALMLGGIGLWIGSEACSNQRQPTGSSTSSCSATPVALVGATVGAGLGYLLGRQISKRS